MAAMAEAWWAAVSASQFLDGSLIIEDSTLDVMEGSTVNLRVKLGERPRTDVVVVTSEGISGVSIAPASRTFTRANWDAYQSFVVTADNLGHSQTFNIPAEAFSSTATNVRWFFPTPRPEIDIEFRANNNPRYPSSIRARAIGDIRLDLVDDPLVGGAVFGLDLSLDFEQNGVLVLEAHDLELTVALDGLDPFEPYEFEPSNSAEVTTFVNALIPQPNDSVPAILTLRNYMLISGTINLSASGPDEYDGVTGSATVTVT